MKIKLYLFLARRAGWFIGVFARVQTRFLTLAQSHGWKPDDEAAEDKLARRQFQLFMWGKDRATVRRIKREARM
jgi:hypothetical protein